MPSPRLSAREEARIRDVAREVAQEEVGRFGRALLHRLAPEPTMQGASYRIVSKALEEYEGRPPS